VSPLTAHFRWKKKKPRPDAAAHSPPPATFPVEKKNGRISLPQAPGFLFWFAEKVAGVGWPEAVDGGWDRHDPPQNRIIMPQNRFLMPQNRILMPQIRILMP
jgi:hypothetical protein